MAQTMGSSHQAEVTWRVVVDNPRESPPPTGRASPALIAHWVHQGEVDYGGEFTNSSVIRWCMERSVEPMPVLTALAGERGGDRVYSVEDIAPIVTVVLVLGLR